MMSSVKAGVAVATVATVDPVASQFPLDWRHVLAGIVVGTVTALVGIGIEWVRRRVLGSVGTKDL